MVLYERGVLTSTVGLTCDALRARGRECRLVGEAASLDNQQDSHLHTTRLRWKGMATAWRPTQLDLCATSTSRPLLSILCHTLCVRTSSSDLSAISKVDVDQPYAEIYPSTPSCDFPFSCEREHGGAQP